MVVAYTKVADTESVVNPLLDWLEIDVDADAGDGATDGTPAPQMDSREGDGDMALEPIGQLVTTATRSSWTVVITWSCSACRKGGRGRATTAHI